MSGIDVHITSNYWKSKHLILIWQVPFTLEKWFLNNCIKMLIPETGYNVLGY